MYADDLVLCGELVEDFKVVVGRCFEVYRGRGLKVCENKIMVLGGEERLKCEVLVDGTHFKYVSEFK